MFDGDIVCHSKKGHGANFIFILALGDNNNNQNGNNTFSDRILNPIKK